MTTLTEDNNAAQFQIKSYRPGELTINQVKHHQSVILSATELVDPWSPQTLSDLKKEDFDLIPAMNPDVLLIGTGEKFEFINMKLYGHLINQGIGVEVMDTLAACRTFNALTSENRRVVAALLIK
ncbi:MAG: Mth938-like domain-containing protein [Gammaproteobacteria bacterium]|nr:Mth938-like domain-containing protein [Gammaproteobacteria bacterium]